ncbi:carbohydrate-binding module family 50 protein [Aspergillus pseudotamarii]|uniref:Carbohydrate-binding module family 50 protein n=1 Tax=Aspergillus pseudotamarii TaxID=132259 RepID=A0A5N6SCG7_ASPPS|nr:carbohydrate-binding module family 50 protein [Aspergillus pseudotamarii]KAE8132408.1 carbohydrate-binding module family 50 protein [Aspergillus pseudotamarii]
MMIAGRGKTLAVLWFVASFFAEGNASHLRSHEYLHASRHLRQRNENVNPTFSGVFMFLAGSLSYMNLMPDCENALYQEANCDDAVLSLMTDGCVSSFDNSTLTTLACDAGCEAAFAKLHNTVLTNWGKMTELVPGLPIIGLSCFSDPNTGKIAMADAYTDIYDDNWQSTYKYVAQTCNISVSNFDSTPSAFNVTVPSSTSDCVSENIYTTKESDTWDSIALAQSISAATMFHINPNNQSLPSAECDNVYVVQPEDTCIDIAVNVGIRTQNLTDYNSQLTWNCSNLHALNPYWGTTLCVSAPGGTYTGHTPNTSTFTGSEIVNPPASAKVIPGTTIDCRARYINNTGLTYTQICLTNQIAINLFTEANPSLNKTTCDKDLVQGNAYCVNLLDGWNWGSGANSTGSPTPTISAPSTPPAPTQTGTPANCNAFYIAKADNDCGTVAAKFGITKSQFYRWNLAISSDCSSGFWAEEAYCVGVFGTSSTPITSISASTPTSTSASTLVVPPAPTQSGIPANCDACYVAQVMLFDVQP